MFCLGGKGNTLNGQSEIVLLNNRFQQLVKAVQNGNEVVKIGFGQRPLGQRQRRRKFVIRRLLNAAQ